LQHRIKNANTEAKVAFEQKIKNAISDFKTKYPEVPVTF
jgi:hypothetical protein